MARKDKEELEFLVSMLGTYIAALLVFVIGISTIAFGIVMLARGL